MSYIQEHHDRITHLHLKDRKKDHGANVPWGQGDTPIKAVLQLLRDKKYDIPGNVEFEYAGDPMVEIPKCVEYAKEALTAECKRLGQRFYLGLDSSTQSLSAIVLEVDGDRRRVAFESSIAFDETFPHTAPSMVCCRATIRRPRRRRRCYGSKRSN